MAINSSIKGSIKGLRGCCRGTNWMGTTLSLSPFCFACATGASGSFSDAGLACFLRILANYVLLPDVPGLLVAQGKTKSQLI